MNFMMQWHNFDEAENTLIQRFSKIGVAPGETFDPTKFSPGQLEAISEGMNRAREKMESQSPSQNESTSCWHLPHKALGNFGNEYQLRALTAWNFLYANINEEATYIRAYSDSDGDTLDAEKSRYEIKFTKSDTPQDVFFWSLTLYDGKTYFLCKNEIKRYSVGDRTPRYREIQSLRV